MSRPRPVRAILASLMLFGLLLYSLFRLSNAGAQFRYYNTHGSTSPGHSSPDDMANSDIFKSVHNTSLGFQNIFVVTLPDRPDKLDAFVLASSLTGFTAETLEGVHGDKVAEKTIPATDKLPDQDSMRQYMIGYWRAHEDFARKVVQKNLATALVMDDSSDWSIYLKTQLSLFAEGTQSILGTSPKSRPHSPYGDDWDLLWLGHCGSSVNRNNQRRFVVENDHTVPLPENREVSSGESIEMAQEGFDDRTRVVYEADGGHCSYAYALSKRGAEKVIQWNNKLREFTATDAGLAKMCKAGKGFKCLSVFPALVGTHKARPNSEAQEEGDGAHEPGRTMNILHSQRWNIERALKKVPLGDGRDWRQWEEESVVEGTPRIRRME